MKLKQKLFLWCKKWLDDEDYNDYSPKKSRDLRAVSFITKIPTGKDKEATLLTHCTEWNNGEGYLFDLCWGTDGEDKSLSLHSDEIESIIACLNEMKYFEV
jgi:hypothetical protein